MKTQSGRSMIEMLGVLAIIGVLSVGGLAGYTRAMRSNRVNNILDFVNRAWVEKRSAGTGIGTSKEESCKKLTGSTSNPTGISTDQNCRCSRAADSVTTCFVKINDGGTSDELNKAFAARINQTTSANYKLGGSWGVATSVTPIASDFE